MVKLHLNQGFTIFSFIFYVSLLFLFVLTALLFLFWFEGNEVYALFCHYY